MKILIVHNKYLEPGGEDEVVEAERRMLEGFGHEVVSYVRSNENIRALNLWGKVSFVIKDAYWSHKTYHEIRELIKKEKPNLAHFHNTFHYISPAAYDACFDEHLPVVQSIHNYRFFCPIGTFYRNNRVCEDCIHFGRKSAIIHKCWKNSYVASGVLVGILNSMEKRNIFSRIGHFIVFSEFSRKKLIGYGFPKEKISLKPNFLDVDPGISKEEGKYVLFAGTLRPYKGILTLLKAWKNLKTKIPLKIVGSGPLRGEIESFIQDQPIELSGQKSPSELFDMIKESLFVIVPSECYETFSMVTMEAYACGIPVIASHIGALGDIVDDHKTGLFFKPGDFNDLSKKVDILLNDRWLINEMGKNARRKYEKQYTPKSVYGSLIKAYQKAIESSKSYITN